MRTIIAAIKEFIQRERERAPHDRERFRREFDSRYCVQCLEEFAVWDGVCSDQCYDDRLDDRAFN